jgi:hypothetical protein
MGRDPDSDAVEAYEYAIAALLVLREAWDEAGRPALAVGGSTGRSTVPHPLLREIREQEKVAAALRADLRKRHRGPAPSAVIKAPPALRKTG